MLAVMVFIVDYTFKMCFKLSIFYRRGLPDVADPEVTYSTTLPLNEPGCINNALIEALEKSMHCIND